MASWRIADVECTADLDITKVAAPKEALLFRDTLRMLNHEYWPLSRVSWSEARDYLIQDEELLALYSSAADDGADLIRQHEDQRYEDSDELSGIDTGIVSLVGCLRALGAAPFTSCCGGWPFSDHHEDHPLVIFHARSATLNLILPLAEENKMGLSNEEPSAAMLYGTSIQQMVVFARKLYDAHAKRAKT